MYDENGNLKVEDETPAEANEGETVAVDEHTAEYIEANQENLEFIPPVGGIDALAQAEAVEASHEIVEEHLHSEETEPNEEAVPQDGPAEVSESADEQTQTEHNENGDIE